MQRIQSQIQADATVSYIYTVVVAAESASIDLDRTVSPIDLVHNTLYFSFT